MSCLAQFCNEYDDKLINLSIEPKHKEFCMPTPMSTDPSGSGQPLPFPGRVIKAGDTDRTIVLTIQRRLNAVGCGPIEENGAFGQQTTDAVQLFQGRFPDT